jgi:hypothetical protein
MKILQAKAVTFDGVDGGKLRLMNDNMGEPFREGVRIEITSPDSSCLGTALLDAYEAKRLAEALQSFLPTLHNS